MGQISSQIVNDPNKNFPKIKACLLITMYIGTKRREMYENKIKCWLYNTNFEIYTVDSSGQYLNIISPRLHQFSFRQKQDFVAWNPSLVEKDSILKAYYNFQNDFHKFDIVFKITGKFYTPELEHIINSLNIINVDLILQTKTNNLHYIFRHDSELVGIRPDLIVEIMNQIDWGFENTLYSVKNNYKHFILPKLKLEGPLVYSGDNRLLEYL